MRNYSDDTFTGSRLLNGLFLCLLVFGLVFQTGCSNDDNGDPDVVATPDPEPEPEPDPEPEVVGYLLYTYGAGTFIQISDTMFSGLIDPASFANAIQVAGDGNTGRTGGISFNGSFYALISQSGDPGIQKYLRDENGNLQADGFISIAMGGPFDFVSETKGYYLDITRSTTALQTFNPSTMQRTGQIDYPNEVTELITADVANVNLSLVIVSGDYVYTQIEFQDADGKAVYDSTFIIAINTNTDTFEKLMVYPQAYDFSGGNVDTNGDVYLIGGESDTSLILATTVYARIKSGTTDFDMSFGTDGLFDFRGVIENPGTGEGAVWLVGGGVFDGQLYARIKSNELVSFGQFQDQDIDAYVVDMNTLSGFKIPEIPSSTFLGNTLENPKVIEGLAYYALGNPEFQGYYTYDPESGDVALAIELEGGSPAALAKLVRTE